MGKVEYKRILTNSIHITIKKNIQQKQLLKVKKTKRIFIRMDFMKTMMFMVIKSI